MLRSESSPDSLHKYVQKAIILRVDAEREELAVLAQEMDADHTEPRLLEAGRRGTTSLINATAAVMRRQFTALCRGRKQAGEDSA